MILAFCLSLLFTGMVRTIAQSQKIIDIPNERSSHKIPTPRGGGLAFVVLFLAGLSLLESTVHFSALFIPCALTAGIGFMDDRKHVPALLRLLMHLSASCFVVLCIGTIPVLFGESFRLPFFILSIISILYLTWLLNLFNFMDGIDGLAALEAIAVLLGMSFIYAYDGQMTLVTSPLILASLVAGFLYWNFPPAKIFMGDVGSGFLGLCLGIFSLIAAQLNPHYFFAWLIMLGLFVVDASYTLIERLLKGEAIWQAHRSHAYQIAAQYWVSHRLVTLSFLVINFIWLFPLAFLVAEGFLPDWLGLAAAYVPILFLTAKIKRQWVLSLPLQSR